MVSKKATTEPQHADEKATGGTVSVPTESTSGSVFAGPQSIQADKTLVSEIQAEVEKERQGLHAVSACSRQGDIPITDKDGEMATVTDSTIITPDLPTIRVTGRPMHEISHDALSALAAKNDPPSVFWQTKHLLRVVVDGLGNAYSEHYDADTLMSDLDRSAYYERGAGTRIFKTTLPDKCIRDILSFRAFGQFPELRGVIRHPLIRFDGTILDEPGYDAQTKLHYAPSPALAGLRIPEYPSDAEITAAAHLVQEPLQNFPFEDVSSYANALGLVHTAVLRYAIPGPVPMAWLTSPAPGTGKSKLTNVVSIIATGRPSSNIMLSASEAENEKRTTSRMLSGCPVIGYDNPVGHIHSPVLARLLTEPTWTCRILGSQREIDVPINHTFMVAGNNLTASSEISRRSFPIRLDPHMARPWERQVNFLHRELEAWVSESRGEILVAVLTIARAFHLAGRPVPLDLPVTGSFPLWADYIGGLLGFINVPGFLGNLTDYYVQDDCEQQEGETLLREMYRVHGDRAVTAARISEIDAEFFPEALAVHYNSPSFPVKVGKWLRSVVDRPFNIEGISVVRASALGGKILWRVRPSADQIEAPPNITKLRPAPQPSALRKAGVAASAMNKADNESPRAAGEE